MSTILDILAVVGGVVGVGIIVLVAIARAING